MRIQWLSQAIIKLICDAVSSTLSMLFNLVIILVVISICLFERYWNLARSGTLVRVFSYFCSQKIVFLYYISIGSPSEVNWLNRIGFRHLVWYSQGCLPQFSLEISRRSWIAYKSAIIQLIEEVIYIFNIHLYHFFWLII